jgi:hypothetical protein
MVVKLWALWDGCPLPPGRFLVPISVRGWVDPRVTVWLEGLGQLKNLTSLKLSVTCWYLSTRLHGAMSRKTVILWLTAVITQNLIKLSDYVLCLKPGLGLIPGIIRFFSSPQCPDQIWGPSSFLRNGCWWRFPPGVKQLGCEADHSPPSSAEVKNGGAIPPTPHMSSLYSA